MMLTSTANSRVIAKGRNSSRKASSPVFQSSRPTVLRRAEEGSGSGTPPPVDQAKLQEARDKADGFVSEDNSGKGNIFPTINKPFVSSPVSEAVASQGLGGAQGGAIVVGAIAVILALAVVVGKVGSGETLDQVQTSATEESLTEIARRLGATSGF